MTTEQLMERACRLEEQIRVAPEEERLELQPEFDKVMTRIKAAGVDIPGHLRRMEMVLTEELVENQFDNMPV